jgi:hypothetical protein
MPGSGFTPMCRASLIAFAFTGRDRQPFNFSAGYLLKLRPPTFPRLGDEEENETITHLAKIIICYALLHT